MGVEIKIYFTIIIYHSTYKIMLHSAEPGWNVYARIYLVTPLWYISLNASILMTVALATERYLAVTRWVWHCILLMYRHEARFYHCIE